MGSIDWSEILGDKEINPPKTGIKKIIKRDGTIDTYRPEKIANAISKAIEAVRGANDPLLDEKLTKLTEKKLEDFILSRHPNSIPAIEEIQDLVETALIEAKEVDIAKAYILYRARHEAIRDRDKLLLDIDETMDGYLSQSDWRVNENANVNFSLGGLILHNSGTITANYWLKNI
ncbi:MAG: ribonucleoside triphosphate reductase, partial [Spirochaetales bacterium]|nr:ribonucleoside triphosphate reductase [Spirochaetales bacterium]